MANYAKVALTGRLTKDPEQRTYNNSTVISFSVAVYTTKKVNEKYVSDFYSVSYWGKYAENVFPKLKKGTLVQVYGDLYQEPYNDKAGNARIGMQVRASEVIKLADPSGNSANNAPVEEGPAPTGDLPF